MRQRHDLVRDLEDRFVAEDRLSYPRAVELFEAMWEEARELGVLPPADPLEGIEVDVRLARILHACSPAS